MINNPPSSINLTREVFDNCINNQATVSNPGSLIIKANQKRAYATFINVSNADVTLILGELKSGGISKGVVLKPNGSFEITQFNLYVGLVSAISSVETKISFTECSFN